MSSRDNQGWLQLWRTDNTEFHQLDVNTLLERFWCGIHNTGKGTVFVPLCGKSLDIIWLTEQGYNVVGVELSPVAVKAFFRENKLPFTRVRGQHFTVWQSGNIKILCGDFFSLNEGDLGHIDIVYDRAALTALPEDIRQSYVTHLDKIIPELQSIFLLTTEDFEFGQDLDSNIDLEVGHLFSERFDITLLHSESVVPAFSKLNDIAVSPPSFYKLYNMELRNEV